MVLYRAMLRAQAYSPRLLVPLFVRFDREHEEWESDGQWRGEREEEM